MPTTLRRAYPLGWWPDGKDLLVYGLSEGGTIGFSRLDINTGNHQLILGSEVQTESDEAKLSPDGQQIVVPVHLNGKVELHAFKAEPNAKPMPLWAGAMFDTFFPEWSPDGRLIAFLAGAWTETHGVFGAEAQQLFVIPRSGGEPKNLRQKPDERYGQIA